MNVDAALLVNMIATGIQAAGEQLEAPLEVTVNEAALAVYVATRAGGFFRIRVEEVTPSREALRGH